MEKEGVNTAENTPQQQKQKKPKQKLLKKHIFFHSVQLSEESGEVLDEQKIEKSKVEVEQKLQELLKSISEETLQLSEFLMEENKITNELRVALKQILKSLMYPSTFLHRIYPLGKRQKMLF